MEDRPLSPALGGATVPTRRYVLLGRRGGMDPGNERKQGWWGQDPV